MIDLPAPSLPLAASLIVVIAAAAAVVVRDGRVVALGVLAMLLLSPFATEPVPGALQLAARAVAALMAGYVMWVVMKGGAVKSEGSAIGPLAEIAVAAGAFALGWWIRPVNPLAGPVAEQAAGFALVALAILPLAGANPLRVGMGVLLVILGASLVMDAWLGAMPALGQLALTALLLAIPAAISVVVDADDAAATVTPAVEKMRPERPIPAPPVNPFAGGELEPIEAEPYPTFSPIEPRRTHADADTAEVEEEDDYETDAEAEREAEHDTERVEPAERPAEAGEVARDAQRPPFLAEPPAAAAAVSEGEPLTHVTGPRPSVRFLGRNAPLRHPSEASQARRPGERRLPGLGRHTDAERGPEAEPDREPADPSNKLEKGSVDEHHGEPSVRENRRLRDPRFKRPLR